MKKYSANKHHTLSELNITPLLDLAFVLLVIFIITTAPAVNDLDISLPEASSRPKERPSKANYVTVDNAGKIFLNTVEMKEEQLLNTLVDFRKQDPDLDAAEAETVEVQREERGDAAQHQEVGEIESR